MRSVEAARLGVPKLRKKAFQKAPRLFPNPAMLGKSEGENQRPLGGVTRLVRPFFKARTGREPAIQKRQNLGGRPQGSSARSLQKRTRSNESRGRAATLLASQKASDKDELVALRCAGAVLTPRETPRSVVSLNVTDASC